MASILGLARRAGVLCSGQDRVRETLRGGTVLLLLYASDVSANVERMFKGYEERSQCKVYRLKSIDRKVLGEALGLPTAQVLGLPQGSGFADKLEVLLKEGVDAFE
jgi:ribosomal protein L7Ae-like RNA K-turn-binding protein